MNFTMKLTILKPGTQPRTQTGAQKVTDGFLRWGRWFVSSEISAHRKEENLPDRNLPDRRPGNSVFCHVFSACQPGICSGPSQGNTGTLFLTLLPCTTINGMIDLSSVP